MKLSVKKIGNYSPEMKGVYLYRLPNGTMMIRIDIVDKWLYVVEDGVEYCGDLVSLCPQLWAHPRSGNVQVTSLTITPETTEEKDLFRDSTFLKKIYKNTIHYYVVPKIPVDALPEELTEDGNQA